MPIQPDAPTEKWSPERAAAMRVTPRTLTPGSVLAGRYQIEAALGQGGMGVVYQAYDRSTRRPVAIKAFFPPASFEEGTRRFHREFRALTRLRHPHIVQVFDYGEAGGAPFYVMEFIAGADLSALRRARGGRLPLRDVVDIGLQLCDALAYMHTQGIVHRDLKPSNIMLVNGHDAASSLQSASSTPAPRRSGDDSLHVKVVDFGLAKLSDVSANLTESGVMLGTINYMSPEQGQAQPIDARADLYSLGVVLYELATGQLPFSADTPMAIMLQHVLQSPPFLRSIDPSIPVEFEALVLSLLAKRPVDRPPSAEAVLHALTGLTSLSVPALTEIAISPRADAVFRAGLIGREAELARLNAYLDQAWAGDAKLVVIEGEAGVGKTRLAAELAGQVRLRGGLRLQGACHETEHTPYSPIAEWLEEASRSDEDFNALVAGYEPELARLVPRLRPAAASDNGLDVRQAQLRFFDAVVRVLARLSQRRPLMLLLDDLQWADEATLELLHYLVRNAGGQRILICATARREARDTSVGLLNFLRDLSRLRLLARIDLERLSPRATADLIAAMLGVNESPRELAERIYAESEGNPFFIEEILKALAEEGLLARQAGRWQLKADAGLTMLRIPATIVDVIERRLAHLTEADRVVLNWAAVLGHDFAYQALLSASGLEEGALLDALDSLLRSQLIAEVRDPRQDRYRFTHAKIQEVVYADLNLARRKRMHRSVGEAIEAIYANRLEEMSPILAHHFIEGGDASKIVKYSVMAGDRARRLYANQEAIAFYRHVIALSDTISDVDLLITARQGLGEVHHLIGEYEQAAASFRAVIALLPQSRREAFERRRSTAEAWRRVGQTRETQSDYAEALHAYEQGLASLDVSDAEARARLLNAIAWVHIRQGEYERAAGQCVHSIELAADAPDIVATAYGYLGVAAGFQGDYASAADYHLKSLALWERIGDRSQVAHELNRLGNLAEEGRAYETAIEYYQKSLRLCQQIGHSLGTAYLLNNLGVIAQDRGQLGAARDYFQQSLAIFQRIGSKDGMAIAYTNLAEILLAQQAPDQAAAYLSQAQALTEELGDKPGSVYIWLLMVEASRVEQKWPEALEYALRALHTASENGLKFEEGKAHHLLGQIYLQADRVIEAGRHLMEACSLFGTLGKPAELEQAQEALRRLRERQGSAS